MSGHKRQVNFELLRIIAMLMIITLHYLDKGGILPTWIQEVDRPLGGIASVPELMAMFLEAFCLPAVNCFVLVTGYFGLHNINKSVPFRRIGKLWLTVIFYSVVIALLCLAFDFTGGFDIDLYFAIDTVFPVLTKQYWFATSYILLMLFAPFLTRGMEQLSQKDYQLLLAVLLGYFSLARTIVFFYWFPLDTGGYDVLWFIVLYLLGGYIARFGIPFASTAGKAAILYAAPAALIPVVILALRYVNIATGSFESVTDNAYSYNHVLCVLSSLGLFSLFRAMGSRAAAGHPAEGEDSDANTVAAGEMNSRACAKPEGMLPRLIRLFAPAVFGVYLIHEHPLLRYRWPEWFHTEDFAGSVLFPLHWILTVLTVFLVCALIELLRQKAASILLGQNRKLGRNNP